MANVLHVKHRVFANEALVAEGFELRVWAVRDSQRESGMRAEVVPEEIRARFNG